MTRSRRYFTPQEKAAIVLRRLVCDSLAKKSDMAKNVIDTLNRPLGNDSFAVRKR